MNSAHKLLRFLALLTTSCALLTGCSAAASTGSEDALDEIDYSHIPDMPDFKGPWADELRYAYARASNEQIRDYLRDEVITEAEKQAVTEAFRNCMVSHGLTFNDFEDGSSYRFGITGVSGADEANEIANNCENETGVFEVVDMYFSIRDNPSKRDWSPEIVECLIRAGVVPQNYTVKQHKESWLDDHAIVEVHELNEADTACNKDPEGAFRD